MSAATVAAATPRRARREASIGECRDLAKFQDKTLDVCCGLDSTEGLYHDADADWNPGGQPVIRGFSAGTSNLHRCCF